MMNNGTFTLFNRYDVGCELGKGTYGIVRKAFDTRQQHDVAIKCVCLGDEGIPSTALREISLLRSLKHSNIIRLYDIQVHQPTGELFLFYECMEMDLYEYMKLYRQALPEDLSKSYLKQMLLGIDYIHSNSMLHRDLKPQNILIDWIGSLKLADFGLGRHFQMPMRMYTHEVVTLWYRSPEILLGAKTYSTSVDLWSIGTIFAEITHNRALFAGECEIDQLFRIFRTLGTPDDTNWPGFSSMPDHKKTFPQWKPQNMSQLLSNLSSDALQLTLQMLVYDPDQRITAKTALESIYFQSMSPDPIIPPSINQTKNSSNIPNSTSLNN
jgi:serine/threonine protein kinase